jgi:hypothetical protein
VAASVSNSRTHTHKLVAALTQRAPQPQPQPQLFVVVSYDRRNAGIHKRMGESGVKIHLLYLFRVKVDEESSKKNVARLVICCVVSHDSCGDNAIGR